MLRGGPIARQLVTMLVVVSGVVLLLTSAAFAGYTYWSSRRTMEQRLLIRGQIIAANSSAALVFDFPDDARETLSALGADPFVVAAALYNDAGELFASFPPELDPSVLPASVGPEGYRFGGGLLSGFQSVTEPSGERVGTLYLASNLGELNRALLLSGIIGAAVFMVSLLAAFFLSRALQGTISAPILRLSEAAKAVSVQHDYSVRAPPAEGDELRDLTNAFNQMLGRIDEQNRELLASKAKLEEYATELEHRVRERTRELETANQALRRNAADLLAANGELDAFAYSASHDLRAPLRSIDGFSQVLLEDYGTTLDDTGRDYLGRVRAASQRMGALIDDLLRLARISRVEMHAEAVDLSAMAQQIGSELGSTAGDRSVEFKVAPGLEAWGDRRLLQVALDNLIRNSWKYTGKQPHARIEFEVVHANGTNAFVVRDNGAGFDMQYADKLFGEFKRLHSPSEFEGTGVGLATVRRIITRHGGKIWAEGAVGVGASFYFTLQARPNGQGGQST
jgi:signal transduction histidine kinase